MFCEVHNVTLYPDGIRDWSLMRLFLQEELDLSAPNKAAMLSLPLEKKWQIWTSRRGTDQADTNLSNNPEDYTNRLRDIAMVSLSIQTLKDKYGLGKLIYY